LRALEANQPDLARQALERVVGLNPLFAGAWLDLAIASYRSGDPAAALEHLEYLRSQFDLPEALAGQVQYWITLCQQAPTASQPSPWQGEISYTRGIDSNANAGLSQTQLALSLPAGNTLINVAEAYLPHADNYSELGLALAGPAQILGALHVQPMVFVQGKHYQTLGNYNTLDLQAGLHLQHPAATLQAWRMSLFAQHYQQGGAAQYNALRLGIAQTQQWSSCQTSVGTEYETRHHQQVTNLGGRKASLSAGLACALPGNAWFKANVQAGIEQAPADRAGGGNHSTVLLAQYDHPLAGQLGLQALLQINTSADQSGYSPLLQNNATRHLTWQLVALSLRQQISRQWQARLTLEATRQMSNLPLFEQQGSRASVGLVYTID
jgi:hypothetical protein